MADIATFRARHLSVVRNFMESYQELLGSREEWIALGGAAYTDELITIEGATWTAPTEAQFDDSMYAIGALERFMTGEFSNDGSPLAALDENVYRMFLLRVAS
jgi:hypothetical protein